MPTKVLNGAASLGDTNLGLSLNAACRVLAGALIKAGSKLDVQSIESDLPGQVLQIAIQAHWLVPPPKPKEAFVSLGEISVSKAYRDQFMDLLQPAYQEMKLRDLRVRWKEPTPSQHMKRLKRSYGYCDEQIAELASKCYEQRVGGKRDAVSVKTIRRIQQETGYNASPRVLRAVAMAFSNVPTTSNYFLNIKWHWFLWRPREANDES